MNSDRGCTGEVKHLTETELDLNHATSATCAINRRKFERTYMSSAQNHCGRRCLRSFSNTRRTADSIVSSTVEPSLFGPRKENVLDTHHTVGS